MKHLLFSYYFITFLTGALAILALTMAFLRFRSRLILDYLTFFLILSVFVINISVYYYITILAGVSSVPAEIVFAALFLLTTGGLILYLPRLSCRVLGYQQHPAETILSLTVAGGAPVILILSLIMPGTDTERLERLLFGMYSIYVYLLYTVCLAVWLRLFLGYRKLEQEKLKKLLKTVVVMGLICFPGFLADGFWKVMQTELQWVPLKMTFTPLFYFFISLISLAKIIRHFMEPKKEQIRLQISPDFLRHYHLTERDGRILQLAVTGKSQQEMADTLFLSKGTIRNYISEIYRKTGVNNKLAFISLLSQFEKRQEN